MNYKIHSILIVCLFFLFASQGNACDKLEISDGELVYVPAYSHIYSANSEQPFLLTVTLSIRNTDPDNSIQITKVDYYETQGKLLIQYLDSVIVLGPLESLRYVVPEKDESGGSGANFLVSWQADKKVNQPIVESIMIGTQMQQGVSFLSRGQVLSQTK